MEHVRVVQLTLHETLVGYLIVFQGGRNALVFDETYRTNPERPTLTLTTRPGFPRAEERMAEPWVRHQRLHPPTVSNLLPEGAVLIEAVEQAPKRHFSLAGVQMKFSMKRHDARYQIDQGGALGDWIVKMPSTVHKHVPLNEHTAMTLAGLAGVDVPEIALVPLENLDWLP